MKNSAAAAPRLLGRRAIVVGGSMAGQLAARVVSDHFEEVLLVERDVFSDIVEVRKGVPQSRHLHVLLKRGEEVLGTLFPGIVGELLASGAQQLDFGHDLRWFHFGNWKVPCDDAPVGTCLSRPLLDWHVRRRVLAIPNVRRTDGATFTSFTTDEGARRVTGVTIERNGASETLAADLVVDGTGRGTRTPAWLASVGYEPPAESTIKVQVGYASRIYRAREGAFDHRAIYVLGTPPHSRRAGVLMPIEGGRWIVTLVGTGGDHPPGDAEGFLEFARSLPAPDLHRVLFDSEPLGEVATIRFPLSLRRHYERLKRHPESLLVAGDALCSFNPIYGQGMTSAALSTAALGRVMAGRDTLDGLWRDFYKEAAAVVEAPWQMAAGEDFRDPLVEGKRPPAYAVVKWYLGRVHRATSRDPQVARMFYRAMNLLEPPTALLRPSMVFRVLRA